MKLFRSIKFLKNFLWSYNTYLALCTVDICNSWFTTYWIPNDKDEHCQPLWLAVTILVACPLFWGQYKEYMKYSHIFFQKECYTDIISTEFGDSEYL